MNFLNPLPTPLHDTFLIPSRFKVNSLSEIVTVLCRDEVRIKMVAKRGEWGVQILFHAQIFSKKFARFGHFKQNFTLHKF